jgi:dTDP-glucose pyrophosphorylase
MSNNESWRRTILPINSTIENAINVLNDTSLKIVLITTETGNLFGTISDGDIRRGLLVGLNLNSSIEKIVHKDPIVVSSGINRESVLALMAENKIQQIPIVDKQRRVIGLHLWDEIAKVPLRKNLMVIMAGGMGSRLYPQTQNCPKPLLPIAGKPILEHIIVRAKSEGFTEFILAIHHLGDMIEDYFGNGDKLEVKISYLRERSPLGTAGALSLLTPLPNFPFIVTNGDVLTDIRYGDLLSFHEHHKMNATMAVRLQEWQNPYGVVQVNGDEITGYEEKPITHNFINAGVYAFNSDVLDMLETSVKIDMSTLMEQILRNGKKIVAFPIHEQWLDVGSPSDFLLAVDNFAKSKINEQN